MSEPTWRLASSRRRFAPTYFDAGERQWKPAKPKWHHEAQSKLYSSWVATFPGREVLSFTTVMVGSADGARARDIGWSLQLPVSLGHA
jgi:hypothetical protein